MSRLAPLLRIRFLLLLGMALLMGVGTSAQADEPALAATSSSWEAQVALALLDKGGVPGAILAGLIAGAVILGKIRIPAVPVRLDGPVQVVLLRRRQAWDGAERRGSEQTDEYETVELAIAATPSQGPIR